MKSATRRCGALLVLTAASAAFAMLPTPVPTPQSQAKAAEAGAKAAWSAKVGTFQLCRAQDRVAARYREEAAAAGRQVAPPAPTPPCVDPGPFAFSAPPAADKPIEASGAPSPAGTAASPPSSNKTPAEANPKQ